MKFALIAAIFLSVVMAFFAVQNSQQTQVSFFGWYFDGPLVIILLLSFSTGVIVTILAMLPGSLRKSIVISKLNASMAKKVSLLEKFEKQQQSNKSHEKETIHEQQR